ncbi:hypothetical protein HZB94_04005 [Candidatus Falkowbacteria bacterium]|nr:hypothetical protein [Candidatus Falkowbacteria bacterium]
MEIDWELKFLDFLIAGGIVLLAILIIVARYFYLKSKTSEIDKKFFQERWKQIAALLGLGKEMNYKLAVIEADKLLDEALKLMYLPGATTFERLKFATYKFPRLKHSWWAHRVRNEVVHNVHYTLKYNEAEKVLELIKKALKELDVL